MSNRWRIGLVKRLEESLRASGFIVIVHDGSKPSGPVQATEPTFYTRLYRVVLDGKPVNMMMKFVYSIRDGWADFDINYRPIQQSRTEPLSTPAVAVTKAVADVIAEEEPNG